MTPIRISTSSPGWLDAAFDFLLSEDNVEIDGHLIRASGFHPRRPLLGQLRRKLRDLGLPTPRLSK